MSDHCPYCAMRSIETARERDEFTRMLGAIVEAAGGEIRVSDVAVALSQGPNVPDLEIFHDDDNRCWVARKARPPIQSVYPLPFVMRPGGRPTQVLMRPQPAMPKISGNLGDIVTDSMKPAE